MLGLALKDPKESVAMAQPMPADNPFLNFPWGPIQMECEASDLVIEGEIPGDPGEL